MAKKAAKNAAKGARLAASELKACLDEAEKKKKRADVPGKPRIS